MLATLVVLMVSSSDESEGDVSPSWIRRPGAPRVDPGRDGLPLDSGDAVETPTRVPEWDRSNTTGRGRHSREGAATRLSHADQAHAAWEVATTLRPGDFPSLLLLKPNCLLCDLSITKNLPCPEKGRRFFALERAAVTGHGIELRGAGRVGADQRPPKGPLWRRG